MKHPTFKHVHVFFSSVFIFLLHLPFVFAKSKTTEDVAPKIPFNTTMVSDNAVFVFPGSLNINSAGNALYDGLKLASCGLARQVFDYAMRGFANMKATGKIVNDNIISIVDFSKPSYMKRLFVIDLKQQKLLFNTYVAHGVNSGAAYAEDFSNVPESNKSSLGFYKTADTYIGKHGYSLHINGLERGFNDNAFKRDIVIHGADYVNESMIGSQGYIGRSWGCPALPERLTRPIIDQIKNGTCLFIYGKDKRYVSRSAMLKYTGA